MKSLLLLGLFGYALPAPALMVSQESIDRQLAAAPLVADVTVESRVTVADAVQGRITTSRARVMQIVTVRDDGGSYPSVGETIDIRQLGGELDGVGVALPGMPRLYLHHRYEVHLKRATGGVFETTGFESGVRSLQTTRSYSRNRTDGSNGDGTGPFLFWDPSFFPVPYYLSSSTFKNLPGFAAAVDASLSAWSAPGDARISFVAMGCSTVTRNSNDGLNNIILVKDAWPFDVDAIAITRNFYVADNSNRGGMILDSDILLNGVNHRFSTTNAAGSHDVQNIVTHEAGHFIGLGHERAPLDPDATMYAVASPNEFNKRVLKEDDLAGLHAAYAGVVAKVGATHSADNCSLVNANVGCASVHERPANPLAWVWLLGTVLLIVGVGRFVSLSVIARSVATRQPSPNRPSTAVHHNGESVT